jgi:hypothetical protein
LREAREKEGVMPKETISAIEVGWGKQQDYVSIAVEAEGGEFVFVKDISQHFPDTYDTVFATLDSEEEIDRLIKVLKKAKRKTRF